MMMQVLKNQPPWAVWSGSAVLALALTAVSYLYVLRPGQAEHRANAAIAATLDQQEADVALLEKQLADLERILGDKQRDFEQLPSTLGNPRDLNRRLASLIEFAQGQGLDVVQLQPGDLVPGEHYDLVPLKLEATASFAQHLSFLDDLHRTFLDISVVGLDLHSDIRSDQPSPKAVVNLVWFTETQAAAASTAAVHADR